MAFCQLGFTVFFRSLFFLHPFLYLYLNLLNCKHRKGFVQLGHGVEAIIGSAYPSLIFGGRNSAEQ
jgi:hypothetical protein